MLAETMKGSVAVLLALALSVARCDVLLGLQKIWSFSLTITSIIEDEVFGGGLLATADHGVGHINSSGSFEFVVGGTNVGYKEGEAAEARFRKPLDLLYTPLDGILVADKDNHCIRKMNVSTTEPKVFSTSTYAGQCRNPGSRVGHRLSATMRNPRCITLNDQNKTLYVTGSQMYTVVYAINLETDQLTQIALHTEIQKILFFYPYLFLTKAQTVRRHNPDTSNDIRFAGGGNSGTQLGPLQTTKFSGPRDMTALNGSILLLSDKGNNRLVELNLFTNTSSLVTCQDCELTSVLLTRYINGQLYIIAGTKTINIIKVCSDVEWSDWSSCALRDGSYHRQRCRLSENQMEVCPDPTWSDWSSCHLDNRKCTHERNRTVAGSEGFKDETESQACVPAQPKGKFTKHNDCSGLQLAAQMVARSDVECAMECKNAGLCCNGFLYDQKSMLCQLTGTTGKPVQCLGEFYQI